MQIMKMHISPGVSWLNIFKRGQTLLPLEKKKKKSFNFFFFFFLSGVCLRGIISCSVSLDIVATHDI